MEKEKGDERKDKPIEKLQTRIVNLQEAGYLCPVKMKKCLLSSQYNLMFQAWPLLKIFPDHLFSRLNNSSS